jgi:glutamate racemase
MADARPIGMLDSGVGGLSVLREVCALLPSEDLLYLADQAHLPYGPRQAEEIRGFAEGITRFLLERDCKLLVIACNAANAAALHYLRSVFPDLPIVGMEPAIKPAAAATRTGVIGVITTQATFQGELFASVIDRFAQGIQVETQVCPELVMLAEAGVPDTPDSRAAVARCLEPLQRARIDQLVLGCTHFPFLGRLFADALGTGVTIVDPAPAVARQVRRVLERRDALAAPSAASPGAVTYYTTGDAAPFARVIHTLLGDSARGEDGRTVVHEARWHGDKLSMKPD